MDRNALAELLQALESRRDAEERRREERYTALIERVGLAVAAATTPTTTPCYINHAGYLCASTKRQQTEESQQKSRESSCGSPARGGLRRDAVRIDPNLTALWKMPSTSQTRCGKRNCAAMRQDIFHTTSDVTGNAGVAPGWHRSNAK
ncbi:UNVERIFIED_CONTAM: hypothetical protein FKN15_044328 [Acipenser sinensis]